jgi:hypothetical protein
MVQQQGAAVPLQLMLAALLAAGPLLALLTAAQGSVSAAVPAVLPVTPQDVALGLLAAALLRVPLVAVIAPPLAALPAALPLLPRGALPL